MWDFWLFKHSTVRLTNVTFLLAVHSPPGRPPEKTEPRLVLYLLSLSRRFHACHSVHGISERLTVSEVTGGTNGSIVNVHVRITSHTGWTRILSGTRGLSRNFLFSCAVRVGCEPARVFCLLTRWTLSFVGAATGIIFIAIKHVFCRGKSTLAAKQPFVYIYIYIYIYTMKSFVATKSHQITTV